MRSGWFETTVPDAPKRPSSTELAKLSSQERTARLDQHAKQERAATRDKEAAIARVETIVSEIAHKYLEDADSADNEAQTEAPTPTPTASSLSRQSSWSSKITAFKPPPRASLGSRPRTPVERLKDELKRYFEYQGTDADVDDPLGWWRVCHIHTCRRSHTEARTQQNASAFPVLARVARDHLAIPATSVSVERLFSKSRQICTDMRSSLKSDTVSKALLSKVWIQAGLLDPNEPVVRRRKHGSRVDSD